LAETLSFFAPREVPNPKTCFGREPLIDRWCKEQPKVITAQREARVLVLG
jgi:hypothetical protein